MKTRIDRDTRRTSQRIADLKSRTVQLERRLSDARVCLERELALFTAADEPPAGDPPESGFDGDADLGAGAPGEGEPQLHAGRAPGPHASQDAAPSWPAEDLPGDRTEVLVNHGRRTVYRRRMPGRGKLALAAVLVAGLSTLLAIVLSGGGASWPASVAVMQRQAARACQNPDVRSEPGQINFACAKDTRQILWVFALMTSAGNPGFTDPATGRQGLEPITPAQGGVVAWSLNLHHPYRPLDPIDSLAVAARAINNIIGGATVTRPNGTSVVQAGLEGDPANCRRYTGSAKTRAQQGFPRVCADRITPAGRAALVADVYQKWVVGATPKAAQDAAVLFENAASPGDPRVQSILKHLPAGTG